MDSRCFEVNSCQHLNKTYFSILFRISLKISSCDTRVWVGHGAQIIVFYDPDKINQAKGHLMEILGL